MFFCFSSNEDNIKTFFSGYGYSHDDFIYGQDGADEYLEAHGALPDFIGGKFVACTEKENTYEIFVDPSGSDCLYVFNSGQCWAVSNSFWLLYQKIIALGVNPKLDFSPLHVMSVSSSFTSQLVSPKTCVEGLFLLNRDDFVCIDKTVGGMSIVRRGNPCGFFEGQSYKDSVFYFLALQKGVVRALLSVEASRGICDLSGGKDSRTVYSISRGVVDFDVYTQARKEGDYKVVKRIADALGFGLKLNPDIRSLSSEFDGLEHFRAGNLGVYSGSVAIPSGVLRRPVVKMSGAGGAAYKRNLRKNVLDLIAGLERKTSNDEVIMKYLRSEILSGTEDADIDPRKPGSMASYYANYRSRYHNGSSSYKSAYYYYFSPLYERMLETVYLDNLDRFSRRSVHADIISACGNYELFDFPFDSPKKSFSSSEISFSDEMAHADIKPVDFSIYGSGERLFSQPEVFPYASSGAKIYAGKQEIEFLHESEVLDGYSRAMLDEVLKKILSRGGAGSESLKAWGYIYEIVRFNESSFEV